MPEQLSRGHYYDTRKALPAPEPIDNKLPLEGNRKGIGREKEEEENIKNEKIFACAVKNSQEKLDYALNQVLPMISEHLDYKTQQTQIRCTLQGLSGKLGIVNVDKLKIDKTEEGWEIHE
jgi:hypothetical protein